MRFFLFVLMALGIFSLVSCGSENEPFYAKYNGYDVRIAPVIAPYFIASTTGIDGTWHLDNGKGGKKITHLAIIDSLIFSFYFDKYVVIPSRRDTIWQITYPITSEQLSFSSESGFNEHLVRLAIEKVEFESAKEFYQNFRRKVKNQ